MREEPSSNPGATGRRPVFFFLMGRDVHWPRARLLVGVHILKEGPIDICELSLGASPQITDGLVEERAPRLWEASATIGYLLVK